MDKELFGSSRPVHRQAHTPTLHLLAIMIHVVIGIEQMQTSLISPEVDAHGLQADRVITEIGDRRILDISQKVMLDYSARKIGDDNRLGLIWTE